MSSNENITYKVFSAWIFSLPDPDLDTGLKVIDAAMIGDVSAVRFYSFLAYPL
jgi:hypothetical protein